MVLAQHKVYFNITGTTSFLNNFRPLFNGYPIMNNPSAILSVAPFPPTPAMLQVGIYLFVGLICRLISMLTLPNPLIQRFYAHRALAGFMPLNTNDLRTPFFYRKPANSLFLHWVENLVALGLLWCLCSAFRWHSQLHIRQLFCLFWLYCGTIPYLL